MNELTSVNLSISEDGQLTAQYNDLTSSDIVKNVDDGGSKRKDAECSKDQNSDGSHGSLIAAHYNTKEVGLEARNASRIVFLRNFNNWIKGMLLNEFITLLKKNNYNYSINALDMCCGKGGDLLKWQKGRIRHLICSDIAQVAVENCKRRYDDIKYRNKNVFSAEFIVADLTKVKIRGKYIDPSIQFDLVSCQFAFHYSFESLPQAECMLQNASECLKTGGYFIGTIPDANAIVNRQRAANSSSFGNEVFTITFEDSITESFPLFGAKYNFNLDGVVDCPEFLVHFPTLVKLAKKYNLELVKKVRFPDYFNEMKDSGNYLIRHMSALEPYPPESEKKLVGTGKSDYSHAKEYLDKNQNLHSIRTLSKPEWEAASLYLVFAFQKKRPPSD